MNARQEHPGTPYLHAFQQAATAAGYKITVDAGVPNEFWVHDDSDWAVRITADTTGPRFWAGSIRARTVLNLPGNEPHWLQLDGASATWEMLPELELASALRAFRDYLKDAVAIATKHLEVARASGAARARLSALEAQYADAGKRVETAFGDGEFRRLGGTVCLTLRLQVPEDRVASVLAALGQAAG